MRLCLVISALLLSTASTEAQSWHEGHEGRRRVVHLAAIALGGGVYISSETFLKEDLAADSCRFCSPNSLDRSVRDAVHWDDTTPAKWLSDGTGYVLAPALELTLVVLSSSGADDRFARVLDDTIPVVESVIAAGLVNQVVKFSTGRRRPFVEFGDPNRASEVDDNTSFYSGHTTLGFALTTSAGLVARWRKSRLEPIIWASGYTLTVATAYFRMAADRHYLTDVLVGAATGTAIGFAVPYLFHTNVRVVPARDGVAIAGTF